MKWIKILQTFPTSWQHGSEQPNIISATLSAKTWLPMLHAPGQSSTSITESSPCWWSRSLAASQTIDSTKWVTKPSMLLWTLVITKNVLAWQCENKNRRKGGNYAQSHHWQGRARSAPATAPWERGKRRVAGPTRLKAPPCREGSLRLVHQISSKLLFFLYCLHQVQTPSTIPNSGPYESPKLRDWCLISVDKAAICSLQRTNNKTRKKLCCQPF